MMYLVGLYEYIGIQTKK